MFRQFAAQCLLQFGEIHRLGLAEQEGSEECIVALALASHHRRAAQARLALGLAHDRQLDLGLPGMSGLDLIRELRSQGKSFPILILTARGNWQDKVEGLAAGADDYVVKPFQFEELEARLNALLRRSSGFVQSTIEAGPLVLDLNRKQALVEEQPVALTAYEYRILEYLMRHHQQVVAKERLMEQLYPDDEERDANVIEVLVGRLRRKLEACGGFKPIDTVRGQGYLFTERCR